MGELPTGRVEELPTGGLADGLLASLLLLSALSGMEDLVVFNKQILFPLKLLRLDPKLTSQLRWPNLIQRCYNVIWLPGCICDFYNFPYYKLTFWGYSTWFACSTSGFWTGFLDIVYVLPRTVPDTAHCRGYLHSLESLKLFLPRCFMVRIKNIHNIDASVLQWWQIILSIYQHSGIPLCSVTKEGTWRNTCHFRG